MKHTVASTFFAIVASSASAQPQEMPLPAFAVGDRWGYRETDLLTKLETGKWTETVTENDANEYWIDSRRIARTTWRGDSVKQVHREQFAFEEGAPNQRGKTIASNDAGCAYPWPLKVGMKFECSERVTFPNGLKIRYDLKFAVAAAESLETAAGRFDTLRLEARGFSNDETTSYVAGHERVIWLAPAAKREVKHEIRTRLRDGKLFRVEGRELTEFKAGGAS